MPVDKFLAMKSYADQTMLNFAAFTGDVDVIQYLLDIGANINEVSKVSFSNPLFVLERRISFDQSCLLQSFRGSKSASEAWC